MLCVPVWWTLGIARNQAELKRLLQAVDTDGSGEIGFDEFLAVLKPRGPAAAPAASQASRPRHSRVPQSNSAGNARDEEESNGAAAFAALQKQLNDDKNPLPLQLLVTMHRRKFLLETIVGNPDQNERERRELRQAEEHAAATNNVYMLSQVRRRQRQRDAAKQQRMERLAALQAVVDRNKRRETMALSPLGLDPPGPPTPLNASATPTSRPDDDAMRKVSLTDAEMGHIADLRASHDVRAAEHPRRRASDESDVRAAAGTGRAATGARSPARSSADRPQESGPGRKLTRPVAPGANATNKMARNRARLLNSGTGMQFAPRSLDTNSTSTSPFGANVERGYVRTDTTGAGAHRDQQRRNASGGLGRDRFRDPRFGMPLDRYNG